MDRQRLIAEIKAEYARRADLESRDSFVSGAQTPPPEAYYEKLLGEVLKRVDAGSFDSFASGQEVVEAVASDHGKWGIPL